MPDDSPVVPPRPPATRFRATIANVFGRNPTVGGFIRDLNLAPPRASDVGLVESGISPQIAARRRFRRRVKIGIAAFLFVCGLVAVIFALAAPPSA